jgi:diamine N-acetyltransferase
MTGPREKIVNAVLREITMDNFRECINLSVADAQRGFVASNTYSLAEAKADAVSVPLAIYSDDRMVGFIMYDFEPHEGRGYITRLMVDQRFQGNGYGRRAMEHVIDRLRRIPTCKEIQTSFVPENATADSLYTSLGFDRTGEMDEGEIVLRLRVR